MDKMTGVQKQAYQTTLYFDTLNEAVGFYLIEQGQEESQVRALMK